MAITLTSDQDYGLHVLQLSDEPVARTVERTGSLIDLDAQGRPVAVEILSARSCDLDALAQEFGFADRLDEVLGLLAAEGVEVGAVLVPYAAVTTAGTTSWIQTDAAAGSPQIPAQNIDLIPA